MDYGVQLYGCTELFRKNPEDFFKKTADVGYALIEPCVAFRGSNLPEGGNSPFLTPAEFAEYAATAKSYGLRVESCHVFGDLTANIKEVNAFISAYGIKYIVCGGPKSDYQKNFDSYVEMLKSAAAGIKGSGAKLCIHNGPEIIREKIGGKTFLEAALERCGGEAGTQIDTGWVLYGGENPFEYMKKVEPYLWTLHYKDIKKDYKTLPASEVHACLGEGCLENIRGIFEYARKLGIPQLLDQDKSDGSFMDDLEKSITLLRSFE